MKSRLSGYLLELGAVFNSIDFDPLNELALKVAQRPVVFVAGLGRTGAAMHAFAGKLNQIGKPAHIVFDLGSPSLNSHDLLVIGSGSGTTETMLAAAVEAKRRQAEVAVISGNLLSPLAQMADHRVLIPPLLPPSSQTAENIATPVQESFEQALNLILDGLAAEIASHLGPSSRSFE